MDVGGRAKWGNHGGQGLFGSSRVHRGFVIRRQTMNIDLLDVLQKNDAPSATCAECQEPAPIASCSMCHRKLCNDFNISSEHAITVACFRSLFELIKARGGGIIWIFESSLTWGNCWGIGESFFGGRGGVSLSMCSLAAVCKCTQRSGTCANKAGWLCHAVSGRS